jgi:hypothetical protein
MAAIASRGELGQVWLKIQVLDDGLLHIEVEP